MSGTTLIATALTVFILVIAQSPFPAFAQRRRNAADVKKSSDPKQTETLTVPSRTRTGTILLSTDFKCVSRGMLHLKDFAA